MKPDALATGDGVLVYHGMYGPGGGIHRSKTAPEGLTLGRQGVMGRALMSKAGTAAVLGRADDVVAGVRERIGIEAAVVMPLRPDAGNAVTAIVRQPEDVPVANGRGPLSASVVVT